jgi:hypothetical protein
MLGDI